jgi:hypothetical protein
VFQSLLDAALRTMGIANIDLHDALACAVLDNLDMG